MRPFILFSASPAHFLVQSIHGRKPENSRPRFKMLGPIPERECQIPELGPTDEIQNYLHGSANADDPFGAMETIVACPELIATLPSVRAVMCVKTLANHTEVTCILMIIWESYPLCCHKSEPLVVSGIIFTTETVERSFRHCRVATTSRELYNLQRGSKPGLMRPPALNPDERILKEWIREVLQKTAKNDEKL